MQEQQMLLLAQIKSQQLACCPRPTPSPQHTPRGGEREERRRQLIKLLAEIERRINEENARPKKRYISPATREEVYAVYYDRCAARSRTRAPRTSPSWRGKQALRRADHDRHRQPRRPRDRHRDRADSGNLTLDRRAEAIARSAGPFGRFNEAMRRQADQIVVVSRFKFTRDETLETNLTSR
jgi:protein TonB